MTMTGAARIDDCGPAAADTEAPRGRVLVVDDSLIVTEAIRDGLTDLGWEVETAHTAPAALAIEETWGPEAVVCDLHMPNTDGVDLLRSLHGRDDTLPVILLSSDSKLDSVLRAVREGAFDYVLKAGGDLRPLCSAVERAVRHARIVRENRRLSEELRRHRDQLELRVSERTTELRTAVTLLERRSKELEGALAQLRSTQEQLILNEKMASLGLLAAGIAHEINNPAAFILANLTTMRGHAEALHQAIVKWSAVAPLDDWSPQGAPGESGPGQAVVLCAEMAQMVGENLEGVERIRTIVKDLRNFSRIEREDVELVEVNEIVSAACHMAANEIRHRARLSQELGQVPPIAADRGKLTQVIVNLLVNAAHAIGEGAADRNEIRVETRIVDEHVVVSVADTGCGIPDEIRQKIFEPFFTTKPRDQGTGLGLSLCVEMVRRHGGDIQVTSAVGKGSRFDVRLPLRSGLRVKEKRTAASTPVPPVTRRGRILLIDDEPLVLRSYERALRGAHDVVVAVGGAEGLARLRRDQAFDLVICDLMMPDVDGVRLFEELKAATPEIAERFVFVTGGAFTARAKEFSRSIANPMLEKPVPIEQLREVVARSLQDRTPGR